MFIGLLILVLLIVLALVLVQFFMKNRKPKAIPSEEDEISMDEVEVEDSMESEDPDTDGIR